MKLDKISIGKYVTRVGPCDYGNGRKDYSYIGEKIKILSVDEKHIRYATKDYKSTLDGRWLDNNWKEYEEVKEQALKNRKICPLCKIDIDSNNIVCGQYEGTSDFIPKKKIENKLYELENKNYTIIEYNYRKTIYKELLEEN